MFSSLFYSDSCSLIMNDGGGERVSYHKHFIRVDLIDCCALTCIAQHSTVLDGNF